MIAGEAREALFMNQCRDPEACAGLQRVLKAGEVLGTGVRGHGAMPRSIV